MEMEKEEKSGVGSYQCQDAGSETRMDDILSWNGTWERVKSHTCGDVTLHVRTSNTHINTHVHVHTAEGRAPIPPKHQQPSRHMAAGRLHTLDKSNGQSQTKSWSQHGHDIISKASTSTYSPSKRTIDDCWETNYFQTTLCCSKQVGRDVWDVSVSGIKTSFIPYKATVKLAFRILQGLGWATNSFIYQHWARCWKRSAWLMIQMYITLMCCYTTQWTSSACCKLFVSDICVAFGAVS